MKLTIFNAKKTTTKFPASPYNDDTFFFETTEVDSITDIFDAMTGSFVLNLALQKNLRATRDKNLPFIEKINYIIIDIDDIDTKSDRALAIDWFKKKNYRVVLGESRTDYRLKGVLRVETMTQKEARLVLLELQGQFPGKVDRSSTGRGSYQAPILKHRILYDGGTLLYPKPEAINTPVIKAHVPDSIQQLCINAFAEKGYSFLEATKDGFRCSHPSESKTPGGFSWSKDYPFSMSHWNPSRKDSVWEEVVKTAEYKKYQKEQQQQQIIDLLPRNGYNTNERYLGGHDSEVQEFLENADMLKIQSPMGTAKSTILERVIHQSRKRGLRVLFVTNRVSLADDISAKYDNIRHYLGTEAEDNHYTAGDDLVVQIDSLHKYSIKFFDVVILDEVATTLMHLLKLEHHQKKIATQVFSLKKRKLVLADAFIFQEMVDIFEPKRVIQINNSYRDEAKITLYKQKDKFIWDLLETAENEPCTFSSGSTMMLKVVKLLLDQRGISNQIISSETSKNIKSAIYKSFLKEEPIAQVLMYSPTLTVGISNLNNVKKHFHYDQGQSMDVLSSLQMTKRTRQMEYLNLCLGERSQYAKTDIALIQSQLTDFIKQDEDGDDIGISEAGIKYSKLQRIHNILENRHRIAFLALMKLQFKGKVNLDKGRVDTFITNTIKVVKEQEKNHKLSVFETYKKLTDNELSEIELNLFNRSKEDQYIQEFNDIKNDETLDMLSAKQKETLTEEEIKQPGTVQALKENINNTQWFKKSRNGTLTKKQYKPEAKNFGFKKDGVIYRMSPVLVEILKGIL